jgi:hypothetical protein
MNLPELSEDKTKVKKRRTIVKHNRLVFSPKLKFDVCNSMFRAFFVDPESEATGKEKLGTVLREIKFNG